MPARHRIITLHYRQPLQENPLQEKLDKSPGLAVHYVKTANFDWF
jgi:hypothetical protein